MADKIDFKFIDPRGKEEWADDLEIDKVVEIYLNDIELIEILKEVEKTYALKEGKLKLAGAYGHLTPKELYTNLMANNNVELLCCSECGNSSCWSIIIKIKKDQDYIYWQKFKHNHREWQYNISYKFDKILYEQAIKKLLSEE